MCVRSKVELVARDCAEDSNNNTRKLRLKKRQAMQKYSEEEAEGGNGDLLGVATAKYRQLLIAAAGTFDKFQRSKAYQVLFHTTQPAHVVSVIAVATVATLLFPRSTSNAGDAHNVKHSTYMMLVYLASFAIHYGAQMWMTFVSGLSLYFALPRHTFGSVQRVLFPKYFGYNSFLSLATLVTFVKLHSIDTWNTQVSIQACVLVLCFVVELAIFLYVTPPLLKLIAAKIAIEKAAGVGLEVGQVNMGPLAACPHYLALHKAFRKVHMCVAISNIAAMTCTTFHLWYLADKVCLL